MSREFIKLELVEPFKEQYVAAEMLKVDGVPVSVALHREPKRPIVLAYDRYQLCVKYKRLLTMAEYDAILGGADPATLPPPELGPNWERIKGSFYLVRTQAGFRNAFNHYRQGEDMEVRGYPKTYPAIVSFSIGYNGSTYVVAHCIHVEAMRDAIRHA